MLEPDIAPQIRERTAARYTGGTAIVLHWLPAAGRLSLLVLGVYMSALSLSP